MANKNYSLFSNKNAKTNDERYDLLDNIQNTESVTNEIENIEDIENVENVENVEKDISNTIKKGIVSGCDLLYLREDASKNSERLCILNKDNKVDVFLKESKNNFYKVKTIDDIYGYCLKDFIKIN